MVQAARVFSAVSRVVRILSFIVLWGSIAGRGLAASRANDPSTEWLAAKTSPHAASDTNYYAEVWTPSHSVATIHLQGGLFSLVDADATNPTIGIRIGRLLGSHLQGGLMTSWTYHQKSLLEPVNGLPGIEPHIVLAQIRAHLVPAMAFLQVNLTEKRFLAPYAGIGAGYEWLIYEANDYRNGAKATATYANFAWEGFGGVGMRLGNDLRLDSELFYNGGSLERDVVDQNGQSWREAVDVNGIGARVGIDILFR